MENIIPRLKRHYLPLLAMVIIVGSVFFINRGNRNAVTFITQASGYISLIILSASLTIGPLNLLLKNKNPVSTYFRRDISIVGGTLAILHSITGLFVHLRGKTWLYFLNNNEKGYSIRVDNFGLANYSGLISALIIIMLLITSNDYLLKRLETSNWKKIQRSSYVMFILTLIHCYFYRIGRQNIDLIYFFYIPLFATVLLFQIIGFRLKMKKQF